MSDVAELAPPGDPGEAAPPRAAWPGWIVASGIVGALAAAGLALFVIAISGGDVPIGIPGHDHATSVTGGGAGLDLSVLCTSGTSELLITGPDGSEQRVRCP